MEKYRLKKRFALLLATAVFMTSFNGNVFAQAVSTNIQTGEESVVSEEQIGEESVAFEEQEEPVVVEEQAEEEPPAVEEPVTEEVTRAVSGEEITIYQNSNYANTYNGTDIGKCILNEDGTATCTGAWGNNDNKAKTIVVPRRILVTAYNGTAVFPSDEIAYDYTGGETTDDEGYAVDATTLERLLDKTTGEEIYIGKIYVVNALSSTFLKEDAVRFARTAQVIKIPNTVSSDIMVDFFSECTAAQIINVYKQSTNEQNNYYSTGDEEGSSTSEESHSGFLVKTGNNLSGAISKVIWCPPQYGHTAVAINVGNSTVEIGEKAFYNCTNIQEVKKYESEYDPVNVIAIGKSAFEGCIELKSLKIFNNQLSKVEDRAFYGCSKLGIENNNTIQLNSGDNTVLGKQIFSGTPIQTLNIPDGFSKMSGETFYGMSKLQSITVDNNNEDFLAKDGALYRYRNDDNDTKNDNELRLIVFPAAKTCTDESFTIPYGTTDFDDLCFADCKNLSELIFPSTVYAISTNSIKGCKSLRRVYCYSGMPDIEWKTGDDFFTNCTSDPSILTIYAGVNTKIWDFGTENGNNCVALYDESLFQFSDGVSNNKILTGFTYASKYKDLVVPDFVVTDWNTKPTTKAYVIGASEGALANTDITSVMFLNHMKTVDPNAFRLVPDPDDPTQDTNADSLTSIVVEDGNYALISIDGILYRQELSPGTEDTYEIKELLYYPAGSTQTSYTTVSSLNYLPENAFRGAKNLRYLNIYDTITYIGKAANSFSHNETAAFAGCSNLVAVNIITTGEANASDIHYGSDRGVLYWSDGGVLTKLLYYPKALRVQATDQLSAGTYRVVDGCLSIGDLKNCNYLTGIVIPKSVTTIQEDAFEGSAMLSKVEFEVDGTGSGIQEICDNAFANTRIANLYIPETIVSIGEEAFLNCSNLKTVTIEGNQLQEIGTRAFYGLNVTSLSIYGTEKNKSGGEVAVGISAFADCKKLQTISIRNMNYAYLLEQAFRSDISLTSLDFTDTKVSTVGTKAFYGCSALNSVDLSQSSYLSAIGEQAFYGCVSLEKVVLPVKITSIQKSAFEGCRKLSELNFDELSSLRTVEERAFYGCVFSRIIFAENSLTTLGAQAFSGNSLLTLLFIPKTLTLSNIDDDALDGFDRNLLVYGTTDSGMDLFISNMAGNNHPVFMSGSIPKVTVSVSPTEYRVYDVGVRNVQLNATVQSSETENLSVFWKSEDETIATVNMDTGLVEGVSPGTVRVFAVSYASGISDYAVITVDEATVSVAATNISLNTKGSDTSFKLNGTSDPPRVVYYKTMDKKIATVNRKGEVKAVKPGTTTVIAYAGKEEDEDGINTYKEAVVNVTVYKPTIAFDKKKITLNEKGDAEKLTETLLVTHSGANETVTWKSSNERIVTVVGNNNSATITAMHSGTAVITAVCNGLKVSCRVQVKPVYTRLNTSSYTMYAGGLKPETYQLKAKVSGMSKTIEWSSDHEEFVTVDEKGLLTAQSYGTATITATANGVSAFCTVKVLDSGVIIYGSGSEQNVEKTAILINSKGDNTYQLQAKVTGRNQKVKWLSTATDVFKVSAKGLVTGRMGGSAEVIATANGVEQACAVTVVDTITELDYSNRTLDHADESNKMFTLTATIEGADLRKNVKWESSDPEVLQISNAGTLALLNPTTYGGQATANITGLKKGRAKITVTSNGVSSSCMVYVE